MNGREDRFSFSAKVKYDVCLSEGSTRIIPSIGEIENIGPGGFCLVTEEAHPIGQVIRVHLPLPNVTITTATLTEVCWIHQSPDGGSYRAGLRYLL